VASNPTTQDAISELQSGLEGDLITPDDPGYEEGRRVFLKGIDRRPSAIARVASTDDVARVVSVAREGGFELAVRSGGHSRAGHGTSDGGIVIDLAGLSDLEIDAGARTASVGPGVTAGEYTIATGEHGLATGLGDAPSVGIGGITVAGGIGFLVRKNGLTIDDLLSAEVVTADGDVVQVSQESEPDLFWAIRGGGGNFGVVTRLQLRLHEISEIVGGMLILPASPEVIVRFLEAAEGAPEELSAIANVMVAPPMPFLPTEAHGKPIVMASMAYVGPADEAEGVFAPFKALATPVADMVKPMRYPELYEEGGPEMQHAVGRNFFAESIEPAAAEAILEQLQASTAMMKAVQLRVLGGAMARVPEDATAFRQRDHRLFANIAAAYVDPAETDTHQGWVAGVADGLGDSSAGGYVGFQGDEPEETVRASYGPNWDRLRELKGRYDPDNLFRLNQNIPPA
jgi:FAD/FMN-containing dehydrogenase